MFWKGAEFQHNGPYPSRTSSRHPPQRLCRRRRAGRRIPLDAVLSTLKKLGKASRRERDLPAHVVVYYVMAMGLYMQCACREVLRCLLEGLQWLLGPEAHHKIAGDSGISQAR